MNRTMAVEKRSRTDWLMDVVSAEQTPLEWYLPRTIVALWAAPPKVDLMDLSSFVEVLILLVGVVPEPRNVESR